mmetsp:Transcript_33764/g.47119  ORF Transcript_33764/g.47119 Transcript_33764/m.47119 type:complete len:179 (-) Transcript_33764:274-810(-)|eukprot:CAMPEP_0185267348 /NCGR_PEP_ID=MMETSP1359-20130426/34131_1 /TAXON_ID=552665 /ORGANISM="Bigelowiella longifila, Strain CCMP242" /LENGTH=178 /DNA_ID=CAMNT_0027857669 /DNA_START=37 /DNA_END=573 /DNA_ORIENTATION=+
MGKSRRNRKNAHQQSSRSGPSEYAKSLLENANTGENSIVEKKSKLSKAIRLTKKQKRKNKQSEFMKKLKIAKKMSGIQESKKSNLSSMGDLASSLKDVVSSSRKGLKAGRKLSNKQKKKLLSKEVENFCAVMEHPAFKNAPIDTINEHITNTLKDQKESEDRLERDMKEISRDIDMSI